MKAAVGERGKLNRADPQMKAELDGSVHNSMMKHLDKAVARYDHQ